MPCLMINGGSESDKQRNHIAAEQCFIQLNKYVIFPQRFGDKIQDAAVSGFNLFQFLCLL